MKNDVQTFHDFVFIHSIICQNYGQHGHAIHMIYHTHSKNNKDDVKMSNKSTDQLLTLVDRLHDLPSQSF
jgi:hypothetical protein